MMLGPLVLASALLAAPARAAGDYFQAENHPAVAARVAEFSRDLELRLSSGGGPYQDADGEREVRCGAKILSCYWVYFFARQRLQAIANVSYSARSFLDADYDTLYDDAAERMPAKVTATTSTAVTDATTEGWKVSFKLSAGAELAGEYNQQRTRTQTHVHQVTHEAPCPAGHRCTIQTLTYHVGVTGTCRVEPIIDCGGEADACLGFRTVVPAYPAADAAAVFEWEQGPCSQWIAYSRKHCSRGAYRTVPCTVYGPLLDASGQPRTSVVASRDRLPGPPPPAATCACPSLSSSRTDPGRPLAFGPGCPGWSRGRPGRGGRGGAGRRVACWKNRGSRQRTRFCVSGRPRPQGVAARRGAGRPGRRGHAHLGAGWPS